MTASGKDALTRLREARNVITARYASPHSPTRLWPRTVVEVTSDDLTGAAVGLAEDIVRLGRKYGVFVDIDADDETLASYGGSAVLRASWMAGREDYTTVRPQ